MIEHKIMFQAIYKTISTFSGLPNVVSGWESEDCHMEKV